MTATRRRAKAAEPEPPSSTDVQAQRKLSNIERDLSTVARRKARTQAADDAAATERDRVIRDAIEAGIPRARIVELTDLSAARIDQIRRGARL
jgi:hypothetical protein